MSTVLLRWRQAAALSSSMKLIKHTLEGTLRAANSLHGEEGDKMEGDRLKNGCHIVETVMYGPYTLAGRGQANRSDRWLKDTLIVHTLI